MRIFMTIVILLFDFEILFGEFFGPKPLSLCPLQELFSNVTILSNGRTVAVDDGFVES